jgi:hypothetical protein
MSEFNAAGDNPAHQQLMLIGAEEETVLAAAAASEISRG